MSGEYHGLSREETLRPVLDRVCGCGDPFQTAHDPPAEKCPTCRQVWQNCATCGNKFGLDPHVSGGIESFGPDCLADDCASYDIDRDVEYYFSPDDPELIED